MEKELATIFCLAALSSCALGPLQPASQSLQPWTKALRDQQPDDAFAAVYRTRSRLLVFVGAQHANQNDSGTFRLIRSAYAAFKFDAVVAEGFPTSWGINPARMFDYVARSRVTSDGFVEGGETVPTVSGAREQAARLFGGEADDLEVKKLTLNYHVTERDLLGFYVLRSIPQWISEKRLQDAGDPRLVALVTAALDQQRIRLQVPTSILIDHAEWVKWYTATNDKPLNSSFSTEEVGPLADGVFGTNKIAYAVSRARDSHLHRLIVKRINSGESVLVVFGGSHLMIQRRALDRVLGRPCYTGTDFNHARLVCR